MLLSVVYLFKTKTLFGHSIELKVQSSRTPVAGLKYPKVECTETWKGMSKGVTRIVQYVQRIFITWAVGNIVFRCVQEGYQPAAAILSDAKYQYAKSFVSSSILDIGF